MSKNTSILALAKKTIAHQSAAIGELNSQLTEAFAEAVQCIYESEGRVIVSGIGKSAIIASKIVATFNSTGTPAIFMHAADAIHGDLGIIQKDDVVICISKSGNTPEIKMLVPLIKQAKNKLIGMSGNPKSFLAEQSDFLLNAAVEKEACPNNLAPTTSTTAQLVMGDALAICLLDLRGFSEEDFAKYHPGGTLGKKLYLRVSDIASENMKPVVNADADVREVIIEISVGIITDGDIRRMLKKYSDINGLKAKDIMTTAPKTIEMDVLAVKALKEMRAKGISQLLAVENGTYKGVVHLHNLMNQGIL